MWIHELSQINNLDKESINTITKKTKNKLNIFGKEVFLPLRIALIGANTGPDIYSIIYVLGTEESVKRLDKWIK